MVTIDEMHAKLETVLTDLCIAGNTCEFRDEEHDVSCDKNGCGIWMSAEEGNTWKKCGLHVFDYYTNEYLTKYYDAGVLIEFREFLSKNSWYAEFYDAGTAMIYPESY